MSPMERIVRDVTLEAYHAVEEHGEFNSAHEAYAVLKEEVDEFWEEVRKKRSVRSPERMRAELVQVAAAAVKAALTFGPKEKR